MNHVTLQVRRRCTKQTFFHGGSWFFFEELEGSGWGDCPYIFTLSPARDSHSSFTQDINEQWEPTGGRESVIKSWASAQKTLTFITIALYTIQIVTNLIKRENIWINVAKFINFVTSSISGVKQLYRRQQCHYSAQFSSVLIQFTYSVNFAKFINYETNSILVVKQLYKRQYCHYVAQFSSMLIQFIWRRVSILPILLIMKQIKF